MALLLLHWILGRHFQVAAAMAPHACSCVRDLRLETSELFMLAVGWVKTSVDSAWRILALGAVGRVKNSGKGDGRGREKSRSGA